MESKAKKNLLLVIIGVVLFVALMKFSAIMGFLGSILDLILPIIVGGILAFFINVPMNGIKKLLTRIFRKKKKKPSDKALHIASFVTTIICVAIVLALVLTLLVPEVIRSAQSLYEQVVKKISEIRSTDFEAEWLDELVAKIDWDAAIKKITSNAKLIVENIISSLSSTVSIITTTAFALIIAVYISLGKENLCRHAQKLVCAYLKPEWAKKVLRFCRMFTASFSKFLSGQCTEALILGFLMSLAFLIFKLPYAWLAGVLTAVCALIPYVGAVLSCVIIAFLTLIIEPSLVIRCVIVYLVVQFVENQFIYPRVVGESVGLPPLYTLAAALIGGNMFGIMGIIFSIPLTAVILELIKEDATKRLKQKETLLKEEKLL